MNKPSHPLLLWSMHAYPCLTKTRFFYDKGGPHMLTHAPLLRRSFRQSVKSALLSLKRLCAARDKSFPFSFKGKIRDKGHTKKSEALKKKGQHRIRAWFFFNNLFFKDTNKPCKRNAQPTLFVSFKSTQKIWIIYAFKIFDFNKQKILSVLCAACSVPSLAEHTSLIPSFCVP